MTLELDKLTPDLEKMALAAAANRQAQLRRAEQLRRLVAERATDWAGIRAGLDKAKDKADEKYFRAAVPLSDDEPLDAPVPPPTPPEQATIIATDGSQIMPDRHAAYLYYLINIGVIVYHHGFGDGRAPDIHTSPRIFYPNVEDDVTEDEPGFDKSQVTIARDRAEIETLANFATAYRGAPGRVLALLDQRLLYWPMVGDRGSAEMVVAVLAVLKTGAAYVPLDPSFPADRLAFMAEDAGLAAIVVVQAVWLLPALDARVAETVAGHPPPPSHHHAVYAALEVFKAGLLLGLALLAEFSPKRPTRT